MTIALGPDVVATDVEDGLVLLDQRRGRYWQLNRTGAATLRGLLDGDTPDQIAARLTPHQPELRDRARADVDAVLASLLDARLVVRT